MGEFVYHLRDHILGLNLSQWDYMPVSFTSIFPLPERCASMVTIEFSEMMRPGHLSLSNGLGMDYDAGDGVTLRIGVSVNELTASEDRDFLAGTPWPG